MALYEVGVHKLIQDPQLLRWANMYWVDAIGPNDAITRAENIAGAEKGLYTVETVITKLSARPAGGGTGATKGVNIVGTRGPEPANLLPLFNTARVTFLDAVEKPEQKYYRASLLEGDVDSMMLTADYMIDVMGPVITAILGTLGIVGSHGEPILGHVINRPVQMRQTSWHRRPRPGYKRGWVPV
jgi:hypothetical protein